MLLPMADLTMAPGPPPQGVLENKWIWHLLKVLLCVVCLLRFVGLDIPGALLTGMMLCFAIIMTRDGMQEVLRYALVFSVLCFLNFFFDLLPLMTELGGRIHSETVPVATTQAGRQRSTEYKIVVTSRPFFDGEEGFMYNVQSLAMILSPIAMVLGCYLSITAHLEAEQNMPGVFDDFRDDFIGVFPRRGAAANAGLLTRGRPTANEPNADEERPGPLTDNAASRNPPAQGSYFQGRAYKLGPASGGDD